MLEQGISCANVESSLERIWGLLPTSVAFNPDLDTSEDDLFTTFKVDAQLHNIAIIYGVWPALLARTAQSYMVQECSRATLGVLDIPLIVLTPELTVSSTHDFALEAHRRSRERVCESVGCVVIAFGVSSYSDNRSCSLQISSDNWECERRSVGAGFLVRDKSYGWHRFFLVCCRTCCPICGAR